MHGFPGRSQVAEKTLQLLDTSPIQRVIGPASLPAVTNKTGLLQRLEVERQKRLCGIERVLQLTHTALTARQQRQNAEASLVCHCLQADQRAAESACGRRHTARIYQSELI